jgi:hypothetical protein
VAALVLESNLSAVATPAAAMARGVLKAMFLTKLKFAFAASLTVALMAGVAYRSGPSPASAQAPRPASELEALRKENELLKLNLRVVLEKVKAQEAELAALKGRRKLDPDPNTAGNDADLLYLDTIRLRDSQLERKAEDPGMKAVEDALKFLREARQKKSQKMERDALEALEKAARAVRGKPDEK